MLAKMCIFDFKLYIQPPDSIVSILSCNAIQTGFCDNYRSFTVESKLSCFAALHHNCSQNIIYSEVFSHCL